MTHTSTEQQNKENQEALDVASFLSKYADAPSSQATYHLKRLVARVQDLEAAQAQRVPLSERIYTYKNQPMDNVTAWRFGEASATAKPGGDYIDHGLSLLQQLEEKGYGIVELAARRITQEKQG